MDGGCNQQRWKYGSAESQEECQLAPAVAAAVLPVVTARAQCALITAALGGAVFEFAGAVGLPERKKGLLILILHTIYA